MPRYRIFWNIGYGRMTDEVDADSIDQARDHAYEAAREDFESQADYGASELDEEAEE